MLERERCANLCLGLRSGGGSRGVARLDARARGSDELGRVGVRVVGGGVLRPALISASTASIMRLSKMCAAAQWVDTMPASWSSLAARFAVSRTRPLGKRITR